MYILCTIWIPIGTHCMQGRHVGRPSQDFDLYLPTNNNENKAAGSHIGSHMILQEVDKRICVITVAMEKILKTDAKFEWNDEC